MFSLASKVPGSSWLLRDYTWFQLNFGRVKVSIWATDNRVPYQKSLFATIRHEDGSLGIKPIELELDYTRMYKSTRLNLGYATAWTMRFLGTEGGNLSIEGPRAGQEMVGGVGLASGYTGYVTANGEFERKNGGSG